MNSTNITIFNELASNTKYQEYVNGKLLLNFDLANETIYSIWDIEGYSEFIFDLNLLTGT